MNLPQRSTMLMLTGLALVVTAPLVWLASGQDERYGDALPVTAATATGDPTSSPEAGERDTATATPAPQAPATPEPTASRRAVPAVATRSARLIDQSEEATAAPVRLSIPALGVDAEVVPAGALRSTGEMEVPDDVRTVGWYRHGPSPGSTQGSAVLTAHVDSRRQGPGVFFELASLPEGAEITVELADGTTAEYVASSKQRYDKTVLPSGDLFDREGPHRLVLITCGGPFDATARSYRDNVVVIAEPVGGSS